MVQDVIGKNVADAIDFPEYQAAGRTFTSRQKMAKLYYTHFDSHVRCGICGGFLILPTRFSMIISSTTPKGDRRICQ